MNEHDDRDATQPTAWSAGSEPEDTESAAGERGSLNPSPLNNGDRGPEPEPPVAAPAVGELDVPSGVEAVSMSPAGYPPETIPTPPGDAIPASAAVDTVATAPVEPDVGPSGTAPVDPSNREVEAKFGATDTDSVRALMWQTQPLEGFSTSAAETHIYTDIYFDTDAFDILRRGYALRLRRKGDGPDAVVALKGLPVRGTGPVHDRLEFQGPVAADADSRRAESWPIPVRAMVEYLAGRDAAVKPICEIRQRRVERTVAAEGIPVALLSVDEVAVVDPSAPAPAPAVARFTEVEAERSAGASHDAFAALVEQLATFPLTAQRESKLERGITAVADRPAGLPDIEGITPEMSMAEAGRLIWRRQLAAMALNEAGARLGEDIEYVHDMRVATRRARSAAQIFGGYFAGSAIRPVDKGLRRTAALLGGVRDLDVALAKLKDTGFAASNPALAAAWRTERAAAVLRLLKWLDSRAYRRFLTHLAELATTPGLGARGFSDPTAGRRRHQVRHVFPAALIERYAVARAYETVVGTADVPATVLHLLRIDCKRLRYVLEPVVHLLGENSDELVRTLKRLQDALGELNDAEVAKSRLLKMAAEGRGGADLAESIAYQDLELERWRAELPSRWEPFIAETYRGILHQASARL